MSKSSDLWTDKRIAGLHRTAGIDMRSMWSCCCAACLKVRGSREPQHFPTRPSSSPSLGNDTILTRSHWHFDPR